MRVGVLSLAYRCNTFAKTGGRLLLGSGDSRGQDRGWLAALADPVARHSDGEVVDLGCSIPAAGGPIPGDDFAAVLQRFDRRVQDSPPLDALLVHASGTLVVGGASGEALLLQHLRTRFPSLPIGLLVDHVAQLPDQILQLTPLIVGPHQWPARDFAARVHRLVELLLRWARREITPVARVTRLPAILPLTLQRTDVPPLDDLADRLADRERDSRVLAVSLFGGFPYADVPFAGASVVAVTDDDPALAAALADRLAGELSAAVRVLPWPSLTIEEAFHRAMTIDRHPVVLLDTGDAPEAGGPGDGTAALWAALDLGAHGTVLSGLVDPDAVAIASHVGPGGTLDLELGGKRDPRHGYPIPVHATVRRITNLILRRRSPLAPGAPLDAGPTVWLQVEGRYETHVDLVVTSKVVSFDDPSLLRALGIDLERTRILVVKSALDALVWCGNHAGSDPLLRHAPVLPVLTPGITTADLSFFSYRQLPRPIWPLDDS